MMTLLAVLGGGLGLAVTASAVLFVWTLYAQKQNGGPVGSDNTGPSVTREDSSAAQENAQPIHAAARLKAAAPQLLQWTYFDYALLALFLIGSLFLLTDLVAVLRDSELYPPYHYGYLLCGFVFSFAASLMMLIRLAVVLSLARGAERFMPSEHHQHEPSHAEHAE